MTHQTASNRAVLLVNLGSPDSPAVKDVKNYLKQFLMDLYVIQLPWVLRRFIVSVLVLPRRPKESARAYQSIWWKTGSPLLELSSRLQQALQQQLQIPVSMSMRYGNPSIESQLLSLCAKPGIEEILFIPLYPHFASSTVTTSIEEAKRVIKKHKLDIQLKIQPPFYQQPEYIAALIKSAQPYLEKNFEHLLFSYHGLPEIHITRADSTGKHCMQLQNCCLTPSVAHETCYRHQVLRTTQCFVEQTGLSDDQYSIAFQSRLGRAKWLEPSTEDTLRTLAGNGVKKVLVLCPAFVTDCLETLEEIEIRGKQVFIAAGGESLELIPCLNTHPDWVNVLASWCTGEQSV
jgi:ferrochelatase